MSSTDPVQPHALPEHTPGNQAHAQEGLAQEIPSVEAMQAQEDRPETIRFRELLRMALCSTPVEISNDILHVLPDESANARLNALLHGALNAAHLPDQTDTILDALAMAEDSRLGDALRAELREESALLGDDFADSIFEALDASLDAPRLSTALRGALQAEPLPEDFADDILGALEFGQPDARLTQVLQTSVQAESGFDLSDAVLDGILDAAEAAQPAQRPTSRPQAIRAAAAHPASPAPMARPRARPSRSGFWGTLSMVAPAVATLAILLVLFGQPPNPNLTDPTPGNLASTTGSTTGNTTSNTNTNDFRNGFAILDQNEAEVEDIAFAAASVQVMQFEDNGPTFILVDEGEPSDTTVPL